MLKTFPSRRALKKMLSFITHQHPKDFIRRYLTNRQGSFNRTSLLLIISVFLNFWSLNEVHCELHHVISSAQPNLEIHLALPSWEADEIDFEKRAPALPVLLPVITGVAVMTVPLPFMSNDSNAIAAFIGASVGGAIWASYTVADFAATLQMGYSRMTQHEKNLCTAKGYEKLDWLSRIAIYGNSIPSFKKIYLDRGKYSSPEFTYFLDGKPLSIQDFEKRGAIFQGQYIFTDLWCSGTFSPQAQDNGEHSILELTPPVKSDPVEFERFEWSDTGNEEENPSELTFLLKSLINESRIQEAIWVAEKNHKKLLAEKLKKYLLYTLSSSEYEELPHRLGGVTPGKRLLRFPNGIHALFKPSEKKSIILDWSMRAIEAIQPIPFVDELAADGLMDLFFRSSIPLSTEYWLSSSGAEISAYEIDQIFDLQIVPLTIPFITRDQQSGSLQYFVMNTTSLTKVKRENEDQTDPQSKLSKLQNSQGAAHMKVLDYLIDNRDRNTSNILFLEQPEPKGNLTDDYQLVAIDHSYSLRDFGVKRPLPSNNTLSRLSPLLIHKLSTVYDNTIIEALQPHRPRRYIEQMLQRLSALRKAISTRQ